MGLLLLRDSSHRRTRLHTDKVNFTAILRSREGNGAPLRLISAWGETGFTGTIGVYFVFDIH